MYTNNVLNIPPRMAKYYSRMFYFPSTKLTLVFVHETNSQQHRESFTNMDWWILVALRKAGNSITKKARRWTPQGCRDRGRPKYTWKRTAEKELGSMKLSWSEAESKAQDRAEWRSIVVGLCPGRSWKAKKKKKTQITDCIISSTWQYLNEIPPTLSHNRLLTRIRLAAAASRWSANAS